MDALESALQKLSAQVPTSSRGKYNWKQLYAAIVKSNKAMTVGMIKTIVPFELPQKKAYNYIYSWVRRNVVDIKTARTLISEGPHDEIAFVQSGSVFVPVQTLAAALEVKPPK